MFNMDLYFCESHIYFNYCVYHRSNACSFTIMIIYMFISFVLISMLHVLITCLDVSFH